MIKINKTLNERLFPEMPRSLQATRVNKTQCLDTIRVYVNACISHTSIRAYVHACACMHFVPNMPTFWCRVGKAAMPIDRAESLQGLNLLQPEDEQN